MSIVRNFFAALLVGFAVAGCDAPSRSEFSVFAQAGSSYAAAVDKLLVASGAAQVDSTSWTLLLEKQTTDVNDKIYKEIYAQKNKADLCRLEQIGRLRRHAHLLGQYFGLLESLATSDTPERTKTAIGKVVEKLGEFKKEFPPATDALPDIGGVAMDFKIRSALRDELKKREKTIREHLEIQERLIKVLSGQIRHALSLSEESQEQLLIIDSAVSGKALRDPVSWVSLRRKVLFTSLSIEELESASIAATKLREAFEGLITGEITIGRLDALTTDIESLLSVAETIKS